MPAVWGSWSWPPSLLARGAPSGGGRPSNKDSKAGQAVWLSAPRRRTPAGRGRRTKAWCGGDLTRVLQPATTSPVLLPTPAATSLDWTCCSPTPARHPPLCPAAASPRTLGPAEHEKSKPAVDFLSLADLRDHHRASCTPTTPGAPPRLAPAAAMMSTAWRPSTNTTTSSGPGWKALLHGFDLSRV
nr:uncharacterized protein LOC127326014 [Lolium perenne]